MGKPSIEVAVMAESTAVKSFLVGKLLLPLGVSFELFVHVLNEIGRVDAGPNLLGIQSLMERLLSFPVRWCVVILSYKKSRGLSIVFRLRRLHKLFYVLSF